MKTQLFFALVLFATLSQAVPSGSKTIPSLAKQLRFRRNLAKVMKEMLEKSKDFSPSVSNRDAVLKVDQSKIRNQADMKIALGKKVREVMERGDKLAKTSRQDCPPGQTCIDLFGNGECPNLWADPNCPLLCCEDSSGFLCHGYPIYCYNV